jgi:signal transduction histidine kinase
MRASEKAESAGDGPGRSRSSHRAERRILLVDDSPAIHEDFRRILAPAEPPEGLRRAEAVLFGREGAAPPWPRFQLHSAHQGAQALQMVEAALASGTPYAVAFVDLRMPPGLDGLETAERLWAIDPHLQVVICTAYSDPALENVVARVDTGDRLLVLKKPFDMVEVAQFARALSAKWVVTRERDRQARQMDETVRRLQLSQAALRETADTLESFVHSVSHDLQSPLSRIGSYAELLAEQLADAAPGKTRHYLDRIRANAETGRDLVRGLLALTDIARAPLHAEPVDIAAIAREVAAELADTGPPRQVTLRIAPELQAPCDPLLLRIALTNLLANAWKFTSRREHAEIEVGLARETPEESIFFVRDNGCGFPPEQAGRLFQNFQRLHDANEYPGTGVGLVTVGRVIARHGGCVWAESSPGRGATFFFSLPRSSAPGREAGRSRHETVA